MSKRSENILKIKKLRKDAQMPKYASEEAAGMDLFAATDENVTIKKHRTAFIGTGLAMAIPKGYMGLIFARSGLACKEDLAPANKVGVIDSDYRGEVKVALHNHGRQMRTVTNGERIAQMCIIPCPRYEIVEADDLDKTERGEGGFGSTGKE